MQFYSHTERAAHNRWRNISSTATLANLRLPTISGKDFGVTGDGSTGDTAGINNAMNTCATRTFPFNGCNLYFPSGIYIATGMTLQSYVDITGPPVVIWILLNRYRLLGDLHMQLSLGFPMCHVPVSVALQISC